MQRHVVGYRWICRSSDTRNLPDWSDERLGVHERADAAVREPQLRTKRDSPGRCGTQGLHHTHGMYAQLVSEYDTI